MWRSGRSTRWTWSSGSWSRLRLSARGEKHIADQLRKVKTPVILVINKVDMVKKEEILPSIAAYRDLYDFAEIVPVSARSGENTDELLKVILKYLPYGPQFYDEDTVTDQPERQIVAELIREKALALPGRGDPPRYRRDHRAHEEKQESHAH